jgi:predicted ester cyclase
MNATAEADKDLFGHPATGKVVTLTSITVYRIVDGRIAERWSEQAQGLIEQIGIKELN